MKIERIILFTKGIETLSFFSEQLGKTFSKLGYEVFYFDSVNRMIVLPNCFCLPNRRQQRQ